MARTSPWMPAQISAHVALACFTTSVSASATMKSALASMQPPGSRFRHPPLDHFECVGGSRRRRRDAGLA
jgi:hypothetical protein